MLVVNKVAIVQLESPTFLLLCQLAFTALVVQVMSTLGWVESNHLEWDKVKKFIPVAAGFACSVFANMKVLQYANGGRRRQLLARLRQLQPQRAGSPRPRRPAASLSPPCAPPRPSSAARGAGTAAPSPTPTPPASKHATLTHTLLLLLLLPLAVDTFITFRSSTPLVLSICDYLFLGRALPSFRSWVCLVTLLASSVGYVLVDSAFEVRAYIWLAVW